MRLFEHVVEDKIIKKFNLYVQYRRSIMCGWIAKRSVMERTRNFSIAHDCAQLPAVKKYLFVICVMISR